MRVFISYRWDDSKDLAGRIADQLATVDGISNVFIDVNSIDPGVDYDRPTLDKLRGSDVCLAVIGERWIGPRADQPPRILDEGDLVRKEVSLALASKLRVLPVLVNGAGMPGASDLPADLAALKTTKAAVIEHATFQRDFDALVASILRDRGYRRSEPVLRRVLRHGFKSALGAALGLLVFLLIALLHAAVTGKSMEQTFGSLAAVIGLGAICLLAGAFYPLWRRRR